MAFNIHRLHSAMGASTSIDLEKGRVMTHENTLACKLCGLFFASGVLSLAGCDALPPQQPPISEAEKVVQRQLDAYNAHDLQAFVATYADDVELYRVPQTTPAISGKQKLTEFYRDSRFNLPALHADIVHRTVIGNKIVDHERITGLRPQPVDAVAGYVVKDGLIQSVWLFYAE